MSAVATLRDIFARRVKESRELDSDLAALARFVLAESKEKREKESWPAKDAELRNKNIATRASEALRLLSSWNEGDHPTPKTFRALLDALLEGWANSFIDDKLEKEIADALLTLGKLDKSEENSLEEALRHCGKEHLYYQPQKLLRILVRATTEHNGVVVQWASYALTRIASVDHLRFMAACLQACGSRNESVPQVEEAARHHIEKTMETLRAAEKMQFADVRGGPYKPSGQECLLRTSTQVDFVWATSKMNESLRESLKRAERWLDAAQAQLLEQLGPREKRGFDVDLIVTVYPHEKDWFARRYDLVPLDVASRSV